MPTKPKFAHAALAATIIYPNFVFAQQVITGDLVVQGRVCTGFDCPNSVPPGSDSVVLSENNTRVSFDAPTSNFRLTANESSGGGENAFRIDTKLNVSGTAAVTLLNGTLVQGTVQGDGRLLVTSVLSSPVGQLSFGGDPNADLTEVSNTVDPGDVVGTYVAASSFVDLGPFIQVNGDQTLQTSTGTTAQIPQSASAAVSNFTLSATTGAVAVGRNSVAAANTVSVGSSAQQRQLTGVAAPVTANDAVPLSYFQDALLGPSNSQAAQISDLDGRSRDVNAMSAALTALQWNPRIDSDVQLALGLGHYDGRNAGAFGVLIQPNESLTVRVGYASAGRGDPQYNLSATLRW